MAVSTLISFAIIAGIILIGFIGELIFRRYRIPSVLLLLATGYILGPVTGIVDVNLMVGLEYIFAPLALIILLFDSGIQMNIYRLVHESGRGVLMGIVGLAASMLAITAMWMALGNGLVSGLLVGAIFAGTGAEIVGPIARGLNISEKARQTLNIESTVTDVIAVVLVLSLIGALISGNASVEGTTQSIIATFSIGAVLGGIFGMAWIGMSTKLRKLNFFYMLTLATMLVLYIVTEFMNGSGAIAVLAFGIILGNMGELGKMLKLEGVVHEPRVSQFQEEVSFLVRTFFFVFLGIIISITSVEVLVLGAGITMLLLAARVASVGIATYKSDLAQYNRQITVLMPRGFATAILATYPVAILLESSNLIAPGQFGPLYSQLSALPQLAFVVIIASILATTAGVLLSERKDEEEGKGEEELSEEVKKEAEAKRKLRGRVEAARKKKIEIQETVELKEGRNEGAKGSPEEEDT